MVAEACANDYEDFNMIVSEVTRWTKSEFKAPDIGEIENALMSAIADNEVVAYEGNNILDKPYDSCHTCSIR
jgi:hypothetical protein